MNTYGSRFKISIFGESHGGGIGCVIDGIPSGTKLDFDFIKSEMKRRAPGGSPLSTPRSEADEPEILSGCLNGVTTGTPLCAVIRNTNTRSGDYNRNLLRPGHADYTGFVKYGEAHDYRGGGHFSGRITAPLVFAGAVAKIVLASRGVTVGAHIKEIAGICDEELGADYLSAERLKEISAKELAVISDERGEKMREAIIAARADGDSVGGIIECAAVGVDAGVGSPFFGSVESALSSMMFSIPAVKGIEFGRGFSLARMRGSAANDELFAENGKIRSYTNNNGGINGGISNGEPIVFSIAVKPTPSIAKKQRTVDINTMENAEIEIRGRHDPCIVQRAVVVAECGTAAALLDLML